MPEHSREFFDMLARVLLRCWLLGFALLLLWVGLFTLASAAIHDLHGSMFGLSAHELDVVLYCAMALTKILVLLFFFFPWLAIRLVLRRSCQARPPGAAAS